MINVIVLWQHDGNQVHVARILELFGKPSFKVLEHGEDNVKTLFNDKIKNLNGLKIRAMLTHQYPKLWLIGGTVFGSEEHFIKAFLEYLNISLHISYYEIHLEEPKKLLQQFVNTDFIMNSGIFVNDSGIFRQIRTHEMLGYCAIIPKQPSNPFFFYLLEPFDSITWMLTSVALTFASILWHIVFAKRLTRSTHSSGYFMFGVYSLFMGQSLPMIKLCLLQTCILQLFVFFSFIMGNCYQSLIISSMSKSRDLTTIKSIDDLKKSNLTVMADSMFYDTMLLYDLDTYWLKNLVRHNNFKNNFAEHYQNVAIIMSCDAAKFLLYTKYYSENNSKLYYMLPEILQPYNNFYLSSKENLFADSLELFTNRIFESGIKQYWETLMKFKFNLRDSIDNFDRGNFLLKLDDMMFTFYVLGVGLSISFMVFVFEVCRPKAQCCKSKKQKSKKRKIFRQAKKALEC